jgi:hypothetical protein
MRRKTQGIPNTLHPSCNEHSRLTAHHWQRFISMGPRFAHVPPTVKAWPLRPPSVWPVKLPLLGQPLELSLPGQRHRSASSWQEAVVPPGGAPMPPECPADEAKPAGAAPCSTKRRHRLTPLMSKVTFYRLIFLVMSSAMYDGLSTAKLVAMVRGGR